MGNGVRSRLLGRALLIAVAVLVVGGLLADAYLYQRNSHPVHRVAVVAASPALSPVPPSPSPQAATETVTTTMVPVVPIPSTSLVADVAGASLAVYGSPSIGKVLAQVPNANTVGQPESLLVTDASVAGWYEVELPVRPNGSQGWVPASGVTIRSVPDYIRVYQSQFRLEHYVGGVLRQSFQVAVGAPSTPTPYGHFYVWASAAEGAPYTPGIFALSAFSPVLENWPGGGRAGIHGWTDTRVLGSRASHGCVRMAPTDFAQLFHSVPLGTPVDILA